MNNLDKQYQKLLLDIIHFGVPKTDRTGTGTISLFGRQIRHKMSEGFPLLTTKKMAWKSIVTELLWFLRGDTNIKYLVDNGCHIWDGDAFKKFLNDDPTLKNFNGPYDTKVDIKEWFINKIKTDDEFAKRFGELGPVYGKQWRRWRGQDGMIGEKDENGTRIITWNQIDQIANLISELKTNPDSRRLMVNAWNVGELDQMVLPPCHYGFQVYTRELSLEERVEHYCSQSWVLEHLKDSLRKQTTEQKTAVLSVANTPRRAISLMWNQRSVDTFLGLPFNIASYGLLLTMIADEVNMIPDELIGNLGDVHLYSNHKEQAIEQMNRTPYELPKVIVRDGIFCSSVNDVILENYKSHPIIKAPLSN